MDNKIKQILIHTVGCVTFLAIPVLLSPDLATMGIWNNTGMQRDWINYPLMLVFFYFNYLYFIPKLYFPKQYGWYAVAVVLSFIWVMASSHELTKLLQTLHPGMADMGIPQGGEMSPMDRVHSILPPNGGGQMFQGGGPPPNMQGGGQRHWLFGVSHNLFLFLVVLFFSLVIKINSRLKVVQAEQLTSELSYLKAQINPHFLFNTLNSIYSLAIEKSDDTPTAVVKLAGMMRYVLSETSHYVSLEKEISYITDYIDLQKLRLGDTVNLSFTVTGMYGGKEIAPLILIPLIENAFKHGVNPEKKSDINISIDVFPNELIMKVDNNKVANIDSNEPSGLGVSNTKNRLQLLYPSKHTLSITEDENDFHVHLTVTLK